MTDWVPVPFAGEDGGEAGLTWGQQMVWKGIQASKSSMHMSGMGPLADGMTVADVVAKWQFMMGRYQSVRTRLRFAPGCPPRQVVARSGEVRMEVVEAGDGDPAEVADAVRLRFEATDFDYEHEWPVRLALVTKRGVPSHDVATVCHLVTDGVGALVLLADMASRDPVTGQAKEPVSAIGPLTLAAQQGGPVMRRQSDAALRYWEKHLRTIPPRRFADSQDRRVPRDWAAAYNSPAVYAASRLTAARDGIDVSQVLLGFVAVALARVTGGTPLVMQVLVSNRFRPGLATMVGQVAMWGLFVADFTEVSLGQAVGRALRSAMRTYKNGYYHQRELDELVAMVGRERGGDIDLSCFFNDRRMLGAPDTPGPVPTEDDVRSALPRSAWRWGDRSDRAENKLFIAVNPVPDTIEIEAYADTHYMSPADLEAFLRGVETVAVDTALRPATPTGVPPGPPATR
jgi:Condensation domain